MVTSLEDDVLNDWDIDVREVGDTIDRMERFFEAMSKGEWFTNQLCNSGIYYIGPATPPKLRPKLSIEKNPIATLAAILRAGTILSFSIPSSPCLCTFFIRKMLNVAQLHLRFFSIRTCKYRVTLGAKT